VAEAPLRIPIVAQDAGALEALRDIREAIVDLRESLSQQAAAAKQVSEVQRKAAEERKKAADAEKKAAADQKAAAKAQADAVAQVEKAYKSALAPHEKTRELLEEIQALRFDDEASISKQAVAIAHLSAKLEDQTRRFEANRGSQNKLSRSLAELLDEQTRAQVAAIEAGAALLKEGISSDKLSTALIHLSATN
jgi:chromosome segregation ATPase